MAKASTQSTIPSVAAYRDRRSHILRESVHVPAKLRYRDHYLHAGTLFVSREKIAVKTILSSGVAVCLWDPQARLGGAVHFVLPQLAGEDETSLHYGNVAVHALVERMMALEAGKDRLQARLFGGANIDAEATSTLADHNVEVARQALAEHGVPIVDEDVHGDKVRRLTFLTDDGRAWLGEY